MWRRSIAACGRRPAFPRPRTRLPPSETPPRPPRLVVDPVRSAGRGSALFLPARRGLEGRLADHRRGAVGIPGGRKRVLVRLVLPALAAVAHSPERGGAPERRLRVQ